MTLESIVNELYCNLKYPEISHKTILHDTCHLELYISKAYSWENEHLLDDYVLKLLPQKPWGRTASGEWERIETKVVDWPFLSKKKQEWVFSMRDMSNLQIPSSSSTEIHLLPETSPKQLLIRPTTTDTPLSSRVDQISKHDMRKNKAVCCLPEAEKHKKQLHCCRSWYRYLEDNSVWTNYVASSGTVQAREYRRKFWKALNWKVRDCLEVSSWP